MSLRIPLTRDQTLQTEFHEIERRLRRLEGRTGITQEGSRATINLIGGSGGTVNLTSIINRIEALEEAIEKLPDPVTYLRLWTRRVYNDAGSSPGSRRP